MKKPMNKVTRVLTIFCVIELLVFIGLKVFGPKESEESGSRSGRENVSSTIRNAGESSAAAKETEPAPDPVPEQTTEPEYYSVTGEIYANCDHDFNVYRGEDRLESTCSNCLMPQWRLAEMGVLSEEESCDHGFQEIWLNDNMPAYQCNWCGDVQVLLNPNLADLKLLSDTNPEGMGHQVAVGSFMYGATGDQYDGAVCFQVSGQTGQDNTEAAEFLLNGNYAALNIRSFLAPLSADDVSMTVRCYGDGEILYQMEDITSDTTAEDTTVTLEVFEVEVLRIECTATSDAEGSCLVQGVLSY